MNKVILNLEIMNAMIFLGIATEKYLEMKNKYGGAIELHAALGEMMIS